MSRVSTFRSAGWILVDGFVVGLGFVFPLFVGLSGALGVEGIGDIRLFSPCFE